MEKNRKWFVTGSIIVILLAGVFLFFSGTDRLSDEFAGTYAAGNGPNVIYFSVDPESDYAFFYADQNNQIYVKGQVLPVGDNLYEIQCDSPEAQNIFDGQNIKYRNQHLSLTVKQNTNEYITYPFEKVDDIPIVFGSLENYK